MKEKKNIVNTVSTVVLTLVCVGLLAVFAVKYLADEPEVEVAIDESEGATAVNVTVTEAELGSYGQTTRVYGGIVSRDNDLEVTSDVEGTLTQVLVKKGDYVEEGQTVAIVNSSRPGSVYSDYEVTAAKSGVVTSVDAVVGTTISTSTTIMTIYTDRDLVVEASIGLARANNLYQGMGASFTTTSDKTTPREAELVYVAPRADSSTRTIDLEFAPASQEGLKEGDSATLDLVTTTYEDVFVLPVSALNRTGADAYVYVVENGAAARRDVTVVGQNGEVFAVSEGISAGDLVITSGIVGDGDAVSVIEE